MKIKRYSKKPIDINDRVLTISGERKTNIKKDNDDWLFNELKYGKFSRSLGK